VAIHKKVYKEFLELFAARTKALKLGDGLDPDTDVGPVVNETQLQTVMKYVEIGKSEGAKIVAGGSRAQSGGLANGWYVQPTIFAEVEPGMRIAQEEIFGPVVAAIPFSSFDDAIEIANNVKYGLSASIYTRNVNNAFRAMRDLETGIVYVNAPTIGAEIQLPFGGTKGTGNGHREAGTAAIDFYSEWKTLYIDFSDRLQRAQIDAEA
jgi:aldehyde dehydrogenase (NAD+)